MIALAGKNQAMLSDLQDLAKQYPTRLLPIGFTKTIERFMAASDFAITKSGGLTSSECLAIGLPMIVVSPISGQKERNAEHLLECGAALKAVDTPALCYKVQLLINQPEKVTTMRNNMQKVATPQEALAVINIVHNIV